MIAWARASRFLDSALDCCASGSRRPRLKAKCSAPASAVLCRLIPLPCSSCRNSRQQLACHSRRSVLATATPPGRSKLRICDAWSLAHLRGSSIQSAGLGVQFFLRQHDAPGSGMHDEHAGLARGARRQLEATPSHCHDRAGAGGDFRRTGTAGIANDQRDPEQRVCRHDSAQRVAVQASHNQGIGIRRRRFPAAGARRAPRNAVPGCRMSRRCRTAADGSPSRRWRMSLRPRPARPPTILPRRGAGARSSNTNSSSTAPAVRSTRTQRQHDHAQRRDGKQVPRCHGCRMQQRGFAICQHCEQGVARCRRPRRPRRPADPRIHCVLSTGIRYPTVASSTGGTSRNVKTGIASAFTSTPTVENVPKSIRVAGSSATVTITCTDAAERSVPPGAAARRPAG